MNRPVINIVMSTYWHSEIFSAMIKYFKKYSRVFAYIVTKDPIENAALYLYFRPHLASEFKFPYAVIAHHDFFDIDESLQFKNVQFIYSKADIVFCLNSNQKKFLEANGINNIHIVPHGYNEILLKVKKRSSKLKWIGFFSSHYIRGVKGEDYFISIIKILDSRKFGVILVGTGRMLLAKQIKELGYKVECYEQIFYPMIKYLYARISVLVISSITEGGPASLPESIATSTPVFIKKNVGMSCDLYNNKLLHLLTGCSSVDAKHIAKCCCTEGSSRDFSNVIAWYECISKYEQCFLNVFKLNKKSNQFLLTYSELHYLSNVFMKKKMINHFLKKILNLFRLIGGKLRELE